MTRHLGKVPPPQGRRRGGRPMRPAGRRPPRRANPGVRLWCGPVRLRAACAAHPPVGLAPAGRPPRQAPAPGEPRVLAPENEPKSTPFVQPVRLRAAHLTVGPASAGGPPRPCARAPRTRRAPRARAGAPAPEPGGRTRRPRRGGQASASRSPLRLRAGRGRHARLRTARDRIVKEHPKSSQIAAPPLSESATACGIAASERVGLDPGGPPIPGGPDGRDNPESRAIPLARDLTVNYVGGTGRPGASAWPPSVSGAVGLGSCRPFPRWRT